MTALVGDFIIQRLAEWGVHRIYGYPGDGINGLMGALGRTDGKTQFIRHVTRRCARSWRARTRSSPAKSACAWPRRVAARFIF